MPQEPKSRSALLASLPPERVEEFLQGLSANALASMPWLFESWALAGHQLPPEGNWLTWVILGGRGAGKTRAGAEWVRAQVEGSGPKDVGRCRRVALVAETLEQAREVMVFGESGLLSCSPPDRRPEWISTRRMLVWPNGATAQVYSASDPERLRGPQFDCAWSDELAKWKKGEAAWDMLQLCLRLGDDPRQVVTTTPRNNELLRNILDAEGTVQTSAPTSANQANLAPGFLANVTAKYGGTRKGRQELDGELFDDIDGALWVWRQLEAVRVPAEKKFDRVVVAVDPPVSSGEKADECGLIVAGLFADGTPHEWRVHIIEDGSVRGATPKQWAERAVALYHKHAAGRMVAEVNQGGNLVKHAVNQIDPMIVFRGVHARLSKSDRAAPVSLLYEQGRVTHEAWFAELEMQMTQMTAERFEGRGSPDRVDALVWAITDLVIEAAGNFAWPRLRSL